MQDEKGAELTQNFALFPKRSQRRTLGTTSNKIHVSKRNDTAKLPLQSSHVHNRCRRRHTQVLHQYGKHPKQYADVTSQAGPQRETRRERKRAKRTQKFVLFRKSGAVSTLLTQGAATTQDPRRESRQHSEAAAAEFARTLCMLDSVARVHDRECRHEG